MSAARRPDLARRPFLARRAVLLSAIAASAVGCTERPRLPIIGGGPRPRPEIACSGELGYGNVLSAELHPPDPADLIAPYTMCLSGDGTELAAIHGSQIVVWSTADGTISRATGTNPEPRHSWGKLAWSPTEAVLATDTCEGQAELLDAVAFERKGKLTGHEEIEAVPMRMGISSIAFSPDGTLIATGAADQTLRVWDAESRGELRMIDIAEDDVVGLAFAPDSQRLVVGYQTDASVHEAKDGSELARLPHSVSEGPAWSPDGGTLLALDREGPVSLYDGDTLELREQIDPPLPMHSPMWTADSTHVLALATDPRRIVIWDIAADSAVEVDTEDDYSLTLVPAPDPDLFYSANKRGIQQRAVADGSVTLEFEMPRWGS